MKDSQTFWGIGHEGFDSFKREGRSTVGKRAAQGSGDVSKFVTRTGEGEKIGGGKKVRV